MSHQNELCDGVSDLAIKAFTPMHVHDDPKIYTGRAVQGGKDKLKGYPSKDVGSRRVISSSETYGSRGQTVFTTCVS